MSDFSTGDRVLVLEPSPAAGQSGTVRVRTTVRTPEGYAEDGYIVRMDDGDRIRVYADLLQADGGDLR